MAGKRVLAQKTVKAKDVQASKLETVELSEDVRKVIEESGLESLKGLLGANSRKVLQKMVKRYWA